MSEACNTCRMVEGRNWGRRVYTDAMVVVVLGRDRSGRRELWVLPRAHGMADTAALREHAWSVARRAAAALAEVGIPFALEQGAWRAPSPEGLHGRLCIPERGTPDDSGVFRLPTEALADRRRLS